MPPASPFTPQRFLNDYGLQWVGEPMDQEESEDRAVSEEEETDWMTAKKFWKPGTERARPAPLQIPLFVPGHQHNGPPREPTPRSDSRKGRPRPQSLTTWPACCVFPNVTSVCCLSVKGSRDPGLHDASSLIAQLTESSFRTAAFKEQSLCSGSPSSIPRLGPLVDHFAGSSMRQTIDMICFPGLQHLSRLTQWLVSRGVPPTPPPLDLGHRPGHF